MAKNPVVSDTLSEASIIGTLIYNPTFILHSDHLKCNHFHGKDSACLYWAIGRLVRQGVENIDSLNLTTAINSDEGIKNTFEKFNINIDEYIELSKSVSRDTLQEYNILVKRVVALAYKRDLHSKLKKYDDICLDVDQDDIGKLSDNLYETLNKLNEQYIFGTTEIKTLGDIIENLWDEIQLDSTVFANNFKPKIEALNEYFDYAPKSLTLWVARYKAGKSCIALNETLYLADKGAVIGYFDSEIGTKEFVVRCLANLTQIPVRRIKSGEYSESERILLVEALSWFKSKKIIHIYDPVWTSEKLITTAKILQSKYGMNFMVFDYIKFTGGMNASETYLRLSSITDALKNYVGGELNIPVLALAQLNRQNEIADSDGIARYASTVIWWQRKEQMELEGKDWRKVGNYKAQVRVNRSGAQMSDDNWIHCCFVGDMMTIYQAPEQPKGDEVGI